jgi:membrane-associated phospholipid phosphatase
VPAVLTPPAADAHAETGPAGAARAPEPGARRTLRARFASGPVGRRIAIFDVRAYRLLRHDLQVPAATPAIRAFSNTGEHAALWYAVGLAGAAVDRRRRPRWLRVMRSIFATQVANSLLKLVARRKRPTFEDLPALVAVPTQLSFPSAHSSTSFAAARGYGALVPRRPLYVVAGAMALSRVYLGVHYPTDIAVGALLGTAVGSAARRS